LHEGNLSQNITIVLADRYDYLAGDHRDNNLIILNAADLERMIREGEDTAHITELITSLLSEELAHERGAKGDIATEQTLAQGCANNTMTSLDAGQIKGFVAFVEKYGKTLDDQRGYLHYLKTQDLAERVSLDLEQLERVKQRIFEDIDRSTYADAPTLQERIAAFERFVVHDEEGTSQAQRYGVPVRKGFLSVLDFNKQFIVWSYRTWVEVFRELKKGSLRRSLRTAVTAMSLSIFLLFQYTPPFVERMYDTSGRIKELIYSPDKGKIYFTAAVIPLVLLLLGWLNPVGFVYCLVTPALLATIFLQFLVKVEGHELTHVFQTVTLERIRQELGIHISQEAFQDLVSVAARCRTVDTYPVPLLREPPSKDRLKFIVQDLFEVLHGELVPDTSPSAHFSLRSKSNSLTEYGVPTTERFLVAGRGYDVSDIQAIESELQELATLTPKHPSINVTFTIRGPTERQALLNFLQENPQILIDALNRSQALHEGNLSQNITIVLADRYDYLAGDHRDNNLIILNVADLEPMIANENPVFVNELITSVLSEELAHERGAEGDIDTEQTLAQECANNTIVSLEQQPMPAVSLSNYIDFVERYGVGVKDQKGYLAYLVIARFWRQQKYFVIHRTTLRTKEIETTLLDEWNKDIVHKVAEVTGEDAEKLKIEKGRDRFWEAILPIFFASSLMAGKRRDVGRILFKWTALQEFTRETSFLVKLNQKDQAFIFRYEDPETKEVKYSRVALDKDNKVVYKANIPGKYFAGRMIEIAGGKVADLAKSKAGREETQVEVASKPSPVPEQDLPGKFASSFGASMVRGIARITFERRMIRSRASFEKRRDIFVKFMRNRLSKVDSLASRNEVIGALTEVGLYFSRNTANLNEDDGLTFSMLMRSMVALQEGMTIRELVSTEIMARAPPTYLFINCQDKNRTELTASISATASDDSRVILLGRPETIYETANLLRPALRANATLVILPQKYGEAVDISNIFDWALKNIDKKIEPPVVSNILEASAGFVHESLRQELIHNLSRNYLLYEEDIERLQAKGLISPEEALLLRGYGEKEIEYFGREVCTKVASIYRNARWGVDMLRVRGELFRGNIVPVRNIFETLIYLYERSPVDRSIAKKLAVALQYSNGTSDLDGLQMPITHQMILDVARVWRTNFSRFELATEALDEGARSQLGIFRNIWTQYNAFSDFAQRAEEITGNSEVDSLAGLAPKKIDENAIHVAVEAEIRMLLASSPIIARPFTRIIWRITGRRKKMFAQKYAAEERRFKDRAFLEYKKADIIGLGTINSLMRITQEQVEQLITTANYGALLEMYVLAMLHGEGRAYQMMNVYLEACFTKREAKRFRSLAKMYYDMVEAGYHERRVIDEVDFERLARRTEAILDHIKSRAIPSDFNYEKASIRHRQRSLAKLERHLYEIEEYYDSLELSSLFSSERAHLEFLKRDPAEEYGRTMQAFLDDMEEVYSGAMDINETLGRFRSRLARARKLADAKSPGDFYYQTGPGERAGQMLLRGKHSRVKLYYAEAYAERMYIAAKTLADSDKEITKASYQRTFDYDKAAIYTEEFIYYNAGRLPYMFGFRTTSEYEVNNDIVELDRRVSSIVSLARTKGASPALWGYLYCGYTDRLRSIVKETGTDSPVVRQIEDLLRRGKISDAENLISRTYPFDYDHNVDPDNTPGLVLALHIYNEPPATINRSLMHFAEVDWTPGRKWMVIGTSSTDRKRAEQERQIALMYGITRYDIRARRHLKAGNQNRVFKNLPELDTAETFYFTFDDDSVISSQIGNRFLPVMVGKPR
ncbi:hypothetical protein ACFL0P_07590, partial [Candidatus Omnitrophota bacterium]